MAQHDYVIANGTGAAVRSDLNNALAAIVSQNSGPVAPSTTYAYQWWADTTTGLLKLRNAANNAWITLFQLDGEWSTIALENGSAAAPSIYFKDSGTDTGIYSPGTDQVAISTGGTGRLFVDSSGRVGLGTSSPGYPLDLVSSGGESIRIRGTSGTEVGKLLFTSNNAGTDYGWLSSASSYLAFGTASTERMRLTSTGLGIGTTSPAFGAIDHGVHIYGSGAQEGIRLETTNGSTGIFEIYAESGGSTLDTRGSGYLRFSSATTEWGRWDSSGRFLVGTSTSSGNNGVFQVKQGAAPCAYYEINASSGLQNAIDIRNAANAAYYATRFHVNAYDNIVGSIYVSTTATAYNTSSDYRLKENVVPLTGAIDRVNQLQPSQFNFIADPSTTVDGFIAHEAQAVVPECVTGMKDEVNADGNPVYQGIDQSKLVPLLTAALQEAIAKIKTIEAKVAALESA